MPDVYSLYFDGSCWPNPGGIAGAGFILYHGAEVLFKSHWQINQKNDPNMSNNVAEYCALEAGLRKFKEIHKDYCILNIFGDSNLVIKQMNKQWKIKKGLYKVKALETNRLCAELRKKGIKLNFQWISRKYNTECDELSKEHLIDADEFTIGE